jgi:molybdopterin-guanine dinucleotide biosynthesis protein A
VSASELGLVVLAGGSSRRWGGRDKTAVPTPDGVPLLAHVVRQAWTALGRVPTVVVAPAHHPARSVLGADVTWTLEDPPGGGPVAALTAGLAPSSPGTCRRPAPH